jgi:cephalosporin hydroxylase
MSLTGEPAHSPLDISLPPKVILEQASTNLREGKLIDGLRLLRSLQRVYPELPEVNYRLACCYDKLGRHREALDHVGRELEIQPDHEAAKQLAAFLSKALAPPQFPQGIVAEQPWQSSVPRDFLRTLQKRLHNYSYMSVPLLKNPFDLAIYSQLLWRLKPRTIVEIGSESGGSALWFAHQLDAFQSECRIFSIDVIRVENVSHPRITYLEGDANELGRTEGIDWTSDLKPPLLVIDDANHEAATCIRIADFIHPLLRNGDYFVVEDGIISDLFPEVYPDGSSGPHLGIRHLLEKHHDAYEIDRFYCDMFGYNATWCTNGFLRRL